MTVFLKIILIIIVAPVIGALLSGADRILTARMQGRKGPPLFQPFYDVLKLLQKKSAESATLIRYFVVFSLCFHIFTVVLFFMGGNFLLVIFAFSLASVFFVLAGYSSYSPYSHVGAERELLQIMCYEPMILIVAFGFYGVTGTFNIAEVFRLPSPLAVKLPLIFIGLLYVLTIKLRKSPFDLSMSHHGHQELVKGITTEMTGRCLALTEIIHWYETVFAMGLVYMFFVYAAAYSHVIAAAVCLAVYFAEIAADNTFARVRWQLALKASWIITFVLGGANIFIMNLMK